jgi:hypothetical protein
LALVLWYFTLVLSVTLEKSIVLDSAVGFLDPAVAMQNPATELVADANFSVIIIVG